MSDAKQFIVGGIPVSVKDEVARQSIGDLSELTTTNKSNIVAAINEAAQSGGSPDAVQYTQQSLTDAQKSQARMNIGAASSGDIPSVPVISTDISADASSDLKTASPKAVKAYVDAHSGSGTDPEAVKYTSQSLTTSQKEQARTNIGAGTYSKPSGGIPASDLANEVIPSVPVVSTDISTDGASDAKTASPKAVKTYVDGVASAIGEDIQDMGEDIEDLGIAIETIGNGAFVVAWDGESTPVAADIPAGVSVTYDSDTYTGSLAASASTLGKIYLVATGTSGNYDRYVTVGSSTYSWTHIGTTSVALEEYATNSKVSQLEHKLPMLGGYLVPLLRKIVYKDDDAESLINGINALLNTIGLTSITAVYTQPGTIYEGQSLDDLKSDLVVTANYNDGTSVEVSSYELSGTLTAGTSSILVTYQEFTTTFNVTVTDAVYYKDGSLFPGRVALRNEISTTAGLQTSYVKDGVSYVFSSAYAKGGNATTQKRSCYFLFDLLVTPGKQYKYIIEFDSAPTSSQTIQWSNGYYDETYRVAGVANAYQTQDYSSHVQATSWVAATKDGNTISFSDTAPSGYVGVRISLKCVVSGSDAEWPTALSVKRLIIQEVE